MAKYIYVGKMHIFLFQLHHTVLFDTLIDLQQPIHHTTDSLHTGRFYREHWSEGFPFRELGKEPHAVPGLGEAKHCGL